jgi:hypothetical protein
MKPTRSHIKLPLPLREKKMLAALGVEKERFERRV